MLKLQHIAVYVALMTQSISFSGVVNAQNSSAPFTPQILPCSYGNDKQCGFGEKMVRIDRVL